MARPTSVQVRMPEQRDSWQPVMVSTAGGEALVLVHLSQNRLRVPAKHHTNEMAFLFTVFADRVGIERAVQGWEDAVSEYNKIRGIVDCREDNG